MSSYSLPSSAKPFTLEVSDQDIYEWRQLLQLSKLGPQTYENTQTEHDFGVTYKWLSEAKDYWLNKYDWRKQEAHINSFPNYKMQVEDIDVHFVALFSEKRDAIPILFMHGWPGSFIEFLPMCNLIREKWSPRDLPYHIVVASLPGYTLSSSGPLDRNWTMQDSGRIMNQLMLNLGFDKYIAQGGDIGSVVGRYMAPAYEGCTALHLNMFSGLEAPDVEKLSELEKRSLERGTRWREAGMAYGMEHGTRPSTIGHVLSSNPLALLAWIGEKFLEWSDEDPPLDAILTNISLYWFTGGFPRSIYPYRAIMVGPRSPPPYIHKPTGYSFFPYEQIPGFEHVIQKSCNLVYFKKHEHGGHFAALEKPNELWGDVKEFVSKVWKNEEHEESYGAAKL